MIDLAYIASPSYSGSTLLTFVLGAHPSVATIGELKWGQIDLATYRCSCGELLRECSFWQSVGDAVRLRGLPFDLARPATDFRCRESGTTDRIMRARVRGAAFEQVRGALTGVAPAARRVLPVVREVNRAMIQTILKVKRASVFLDSSKDPVRLLHLMRTGNYNIRVIQLVRDVRGVANSARKNEGVEPRFAAKEWLRTHGQVDRLRRMLGDDRVERVRYEDLCANPSGVANSLFEFLGLEPIDGEPDIASTENHILGNRMRLSMGDGIRLDEKWRTGLSPADLADIHSVAGKLHQAYGYES